MKKGFVPLALTGALVVGVVAGVLVASAAPPDRLFSDPKKSSARAILATPARLTVFFWPAAGHCSPVEFGLIGSLEKFAERFPDTRVVSVVSTDFPGSERYGRELPGTIVRVSPSALAEEAASSPLPRVEIWGQDWRLLLFRAIAAVSSEAETLTTELERARGLTKPVPMSAPAEKEQSHE